MYEYIIIAHIYMCIYIYIDIYAHTYIVLPRMEASRLLVVAGDPLAYLPYSTPL